MFDLLDSVSDGAITAAALPAEHLEDMRLLADVEACLADGQISALRQAWDTWRRDHLHHLEHEEEVMMPLTMKTGGSPAERARTVHERILLPSESLPDFDWSIGWVIGKLSREGSASQPPAVATRVYAWGLQHACSPDQWNRLRPIVREHCTPEIWEELARDYGLGEIYLWPINADEEATPRQVRRVIDRVRAEQIPSVFSESTVSDKAMRQVARETGARFGGVLHVDSLTDERGPVPTYLQLLQANADTLVRGLTGTPNP